MDKTILEKFESYPPKARECLNEIRAMIFEVAEDENLGEVTEALKWGEPSYPAKMGSPIRIDWKPEYPDQVSVFVHCKTTLIETYKEIYKDTFKYLGKREVVISLSEPMPVQSLKHCISMALKYHKLKKLPLLGA